jgi:hypothetical protein
MMDLDAAQSANVAAYQDGDHQCGGDHREEKEHSLA